MPHAGGARGYGAMRRDGDIAPYRHAARGVRTAMPHAGGAVWCRGSAAVGGTGRRALRSYRGRTETPPAKLSACATCHAARGVRTTTGHAHYSGGAMGTSRPTAITHAKFARHYTPRITRCRAALVVRTRPPKNNLCAPIHPAQKLFVPLCVKTSRPPPCPWRITHAIFARVGRTRITLRRDGDIAPYRHYTRVVRFNCACHYTRASPVAARHRALHQDG